MDGTQADRRIQDAVVVEAGSSTGGAPNVSESRDAAGTRVGSDSQGSGANPAGGRNGSVQTTTIWKARKGLRDVDADQFTPVRVSIGAYTYHRYGHLNGSNKRTVADMICPPDSTMWDDVRRELERQLAAAGTGDDNPAWYDPDIVDADASTMGGYFSFSGTGTASDGIITSPLMDDGCYVLHHLVEYEDEETENVVNREDERGGNGNSVMRDILCLLENQIPWSVLRGVHRYTRKDGSSMSDSDLDKELAGRVQKQLEGRLFTVSGGGRRKPVPSPAPTHLLHLVHHYLKPTTVLKNDDKQAGAAPANNGASIIAGTNNQQRPIGADSSRPVAPTPTAAASTSSREHRVNIVDRMGRWRRATEYRRYGNVKLKPRKFKEGKVESVLDVRLKGRTLSIPTLRIDTLTFTLLRNLIAFEDLMDKGQPRPVTAYCVFMSQLACKTEDVELLQRLDILQNFLPTDDHVAQGFANLCKGVVFKVDDTTVNYLNRTWHKLHKRCREPNTLLGWFKEKNCSNSVQVIALIAAAFLFLFEAAQAVCAILSYLKQVGKI